MFGLTFLFPAVLVAASAAIAPIIIHLTMRTRPREIVFPAMRFVRKTHRANISKLRLKHLLLLLLRMAAIAAIALLIARPRIPEWIKAPDRSVPTAAVLVIDTSGSMTGRRGGRTLLARARRLALQAIDALPPGSRIAVVPTADPHRTAGLLGDRKLLAQQVADVPEGYGGESVGPAIRRARALLAGADLPRKELYVLTDMTHPGWENTSGEDLEGVQVTVLDCAGHQLGNIGLDELRLPATRFPVGVTVPIEIVLRSTELGGEVTVRAELDGRAAAEKSVGVPPGGDAAVTLEVSPQRVGVLHGRVTVQCDDALEMDNVRHFTLHVDPPAGMLIVRDPSTVGRRGAVSFLMANAVAPPGGTRRWVVRRTITADRLDEEALKEVRIVMLTDVGAISRMQWGALERFVRSGGRLWVVGGSLLSPESYNTPSAQRLLPVAFGPPEQLSEPVGWDVPDAAHPMLAPFAHGDNPPLSDIRCTRRHAIATQSPAAEVVVRYRDGVPAIVTRNVASGTVVLWNFSPVRGFSNLGPLAQFPILAQRTVRLLTSPLDERVSYHWGEAITLEVPPSILRPVASVRRGGSQVDEPITIDPRKRAVVLTGDRLGGWRVRFAEGDREAGAVDFVERGFSVNPDPAESDLKRLPPEEVAAMFPSSDVLIAREVSELGGRERTVRRPLELAVAVLLGLLVLVTVESFFANRFYRRPPAQPDQ